MKIVIVSLIISFLDFRYEAKRLEIETWLARMESRSERMGSVATTADVLEAQQKEQKVRTFLINIIYHFSVVQKKRHFSIIFQFQNYYYTSFGINHKPSFYHYRW